MMQILRYPDPRLTLPNKPLGSWSAEVQKNVEEMFKVMANLNGVGLAAPQVGWNVRLFIMVIADSKSGETRETVVFDPTLEILGNLEAMDEGCLSFPGLSARIVRWDRVRLKGMTPDGSIDEVLFGLSAQAAQHEMDHLDGILYIEKMTPADRKRWDPAIRKMEEDWKKRKKG